MCAGIQTGRLWTRRGGSGGIRFVHIETQEVTGPGPEQHFWRRSIKGGGGAACPSTHVSGFRGSLAGRFPGAVCAPRESRPANYGPKVALAEEYRMGGTCVIRGCVPKKLMVFASEFPGAVADAQAYGWDAQISGFDWGAFRAKLDAELTRLEGLYLKGLDGAGVTVFDCRATLDRPTYGGTGRWPQRSRRGIF